MKKKSAWSRLVAMMLAIAMVLTSQPVNVLAGDGTGLGLYGAGGIMQIANGTEHKLENSWIKDLGLYRYDESKSDHKGTRLENGNTVEHDEPIVFEITYRVPEGTTIHSGDTLTYELPDHIDGSAAGNQKGKVYNSNNQEMGTYVIDENGNVTITFTKPILFTERP